MVHRHNFLWGKWNCASRASRAAMALSDWAAGAPPKAVPIWIAGMPDEIRIFKNDQDKQGHQLHHPNKLAQSVECMSILRQHDVDDTEYEYEGQAVHCVAMLQPAFTYDALRNLIFLEEMQREFYAFMSGDCNVEHLHFFRVTQIVKLPHLRLLPVMTSHVFLSRLPEWFVTNLISDVDEALPGQEVQREAWPILNETDAQIVLRIPKPFAAMVANDIMQSVAMCEMGRRSRPDIVRPSWCIGWARTSWFNDICRGFQFLSHRQDTKGRFYPPPCPTWMREYEGLDLEGLRCLATSVRAVLPHISQLRQDAALQQKMSTLHNWVACLQQRIDIDSLPTSKVPQNRRYDISTLISAFMSGQLLKNDSSLRDATIWCVQACLKPEVAEKICAQIRANTVRVPSPATISRTRARVDVAYMLHFRTVLKDLFDHHGGAVIYAMADKSPQGGREYEQVVLNIIKRSMLNVLQSQIQMMESRHCKLFV